MSDLDERQRNPEVPKSENMIQYLFNQYNGIKDTLEGIRQAPRVYRKVKEANLAYEAEKDKIASKKNGKTPIVTAQDIIEEMYR